MRVRLTPELQRLIEEEVASGRYASADDVVREGLRLLLRERRCCEEIHRKIAAGVAQAMAGELVDGEEAFERVRRRIEGRHGTGA